MDIKEEILEKLKLFEDVNFKFDEASHSYTYGNTKFVSVTNFLKNFVKPFNESFWSEKKAKDLLKEENKELTPENIELYKEAIKVKWDNKKNIACDLGTLIHLFIEARFKGEDIDINSYDEITKERLLKFEKIYVDRLHKLTPVAQEVRVFSKVLKIAGTFDALFEKDGELFLLDWKTNSAKFTTDKDKAYNKLLQPFHKEDENTMNKYSIQVSIYRMILESVGIYIKDCAIVHIPPEGEAKIYKAKDFRRQLTMFFGGKI